MSVGNFCLRSANVGHGIVVSVSPVLLMSLMSSSAIALVLVIVSKFVLGVCMSLIIIVCN